MDHIDLASSQWCVIHAIDNFPICDSTISDLIFKPVGQYEAIVHVPYNRIAPE